MRLLGVREVEGAQACRVGPLGKQRGRLGGGKIALSMGGREADVSRRLYSLIHLDSTSAA